MGSGHDNNDYNNDHDHSYYDADDCDDNGRVVVLMMMLVVVTMADFLFNDIEQGEKVNLTSFNFKDCHH